MNMLEKMSRSAHARARRDFIDLPPWEQMPKEAREQAKAMANAMLYALLEPTKEMEIAAMEPGDGTSPTRTAARFDKRAVFIRTYPRDVWTTSGRHDTGLPSAKPGAESAGCGDTSSVMRPPLGATGSLGSAAALSLAFSDWR